MNGGREKKGPSPWQGFLKRSFDVIGALVGLTLTWWIILIAYLAAWIDTGKSGFFRQERVGKEGSRFKTIKIRTMRDIPGFDTNVSSLDDPRITRLGGNFRKYKIDELPQLVNVLLGDMSFVGPRPDVPGYADRLKGEDSVILKVRPGITGPATLKYRNEEELLMQQKDPEKYNDEVIYPDKVNINREYIENYSFVSDLRYILETVKLVFNG